LGWAVGPADACAYRAWITDGEQPWAAITAAASPGQGRWVPHVVVDDLTEATKRATELGAKSSSTPPPGRPERRC